MPRIPTAPSVTFALHCRAMRLGPVREYEFVEGRKWRFDFAWPDQMIGVEIEGGTAFGKSRHSRGQGFVNDCSKYNAAARLGWRVFRYTTEMVAAGTAIDEVKALLGA